MKKTKPMGIQMGIATLVIAAVFTLANCFMYMMGKAYTVMLVMTPMLILGGISFLVFPGTEPAPGVPANKRPAEWWKRSPLKNKLIWITAMIVGLALGVWLMVTYVKLVP